jgi:hypothetical protein
MFSNKNFFISVTPIYYGGAGDFLSEVIKYYPKFIKLYPRSYFRKIKILNRIFSKIQIIIINIIINIISKINIKRLVLFHFQSINYKLCSRLISKAQEIEFWVLDAVIFCKKSYNTYDGKVCFKCFDYFEPFDDCFHYPNLKNTDSEYKKFYDLLIKREKNITYICQNDNYIKLVNKKFENSKTILRTLIFDELRDFAINYNKKIFKNYSFDISFHGNFHEAKGVKYFLNIVKNKKDLNFFLPHYDENILNEFNNLVIKNYRWGNRLIEYYEKTKIILCPSFWTCPPEAAVIKSMLMGKVVGIIDSEYSFSNEIPDNAVLKLTGILSKDIEKIDKILLNEDIQFHISNNAKEWSRRYILN